MHMPINHAANIKKDGYGRIESGRIESVPEEE